MAVLWASKININSNIFDIYQEPDKIKEIQSLLRSNIENGIEYLKRIEFDDGTNKYINESTFQFATIEHLGDNYNNAICGYVVKSHTIFTYRVDVETGSTTTIPNENDEKVLFYYDVDREIVVFHESRRFGYKEFNETFSELLNKAMKDTRYTFVVSLINRGLNISEIRRELKKIGRIEELSIKIIPPNPNEQLIKRIKKNGLEKLAEYEEANVTMKEIKYQSKAPEGINLASRMIEDSLKEIEGVNSQLGEGEALDNGYLKVDATNKSGKKLTSEEMKPIKGTIKEEEKVISKFSDVGNKFVISILVDLGEKDV